VVAAYFHDRSRQPSTFNIRPVAAAATATATAAAARPRCRCQAAALPPSLLPGRHPPPQLTFSCCRLPLMVSSPPSTAASRPLALSGCSPHGTVASRPPPSHPRCCDLPPAGAGPSIYHPGAHLSAIVIVTSPAPHPAVTARPPSLPGRRRCPPAPAATHQHPCCRRLLCVVVQGCQRPSLAGSLSLQLAAWDSPWLASRYHRPSHAAAPTNIQDLLDP